MKKLTKKQEQVLDWIEASIQKTGQAPTVRELQAMLGCSSPMGAAAHINALEAKGYLTKVDGKSRGIMVNKGDAIKGDDDIVQVPLVGSVACGMPIWAEEMIEEIIPLPKAFVKYTKDVFMLKAQGDSMNLAGIDDGDYIIFHKQNVAEEGDKVVVLIGSEATVKKYRVDKEHKRVVFQPMSDNPTHAPIIPELGTFMIQGKVIGVVKNNF
jgi:repressor LexA